LEHTTNISLDQVDNRFLFVLVSAKRALQLQKGAKPKVEAPTKKPTVVAMVETVEQKVPFQLPAKGKEKRSK
jgi:DNA-directed RNA polymerase omega subunit